MVEKLQQKISALEDENKELRQSTEKCFTETEKLESWEKALVDDLFSLLQKSSNEVKQLQEYFNQKKTALQKTQAEKSKILSELVDLHGNYNSVSDKLEKNNRKFWCTLLISISLEKSLKIYDDSFHKKTRQLDLNPTIEFTNITWCVNGLTSVEMDDVSKLSTRFQWK